MKARVGDEVVLNAPGGREALAILAVRYEAIESALFVPEAPISLNVGNFAKAQ